MSDLRKAAEQALEMLGHCTPDKRYGDDYLEREFAELNAVRKALRAALAEPEQSEPVATLDDLEQEIYENTREFISPAVLEWMLKRYYTAAPPRRRPLTDEQIKELTSCLGFGHVSPITIARAIEQAHGIGEKT